MTTALVPVGDLEKMANAISGSRLFGALTPEQAMALMLVAQAEGLHPATAARDYHVIQGRPTLKADAMLSRHIASGGKVEWHMYTDQRVEATFSHPSGGTVKIDWDFARAKQAGLGNKDMWLKYPRQMLRSRVISEGIKTVNPGVATGFYTPEEVSDFEPAGRGKGQKAKDMGAAEVVPDDQSRQGDATPSASTSSPTPAGAVQSERYTTFKEALSKTALTEKKVLAHLGVESIDELTEELWLDTLAGLRKKAKPAA